MAMAVITKYDTPASLRDVPESSPFYDSWHQFVNGVVAESSDSPWIDPVLVDPDVVTLRTLSWIGFPRNTLTVERRDDHTKGFMEAEDRGSQFGVDGLLRAKLARSGPFPVLGTRFRLARRGWHPRSAAHFVGGVGSSP
jgi:hypothetical protein